MSSSSSSKNQIRSTSKPRITDPIILKIDQHLKKLRESEATSTSPMQAITFGLTGLGGLYRCVGEANTHLVKGTSKLLEVCNAFREAVSGLREAVVDLRSSVLESSRYFSLRKEMVKSARGLWLRIREVEGELMSENRELMVSNQEELMDLSTAIRCVSIISISVLESLLQVLAVPVTPLMSKKSRSMMGCWMRRRKKTHPEGEEGTERGNELRNVDVVLVGGSGGEIAQKRLRELEDGLRGILNGLRCISIQLTKHTTTTLSSNFM